MILLLRCLRFVRIGYCLEVSIAFILVSSNLKPILIQESNETYISPEEHPKIFGNAQAEFMIQ